jgi:predicted dehydrogenase
MSTQPPLRGIIVGAGRAGTDLHFGAFRNAGAEIRAFVDVVRERAEDASRECGVPAAYTSLEEALRVERPDFVSICSAPKSHYPLAEMAIRAGAHLLIEKPVTATFEEAKKLKTLAEASKRYVAVVHNRRFWSGITKAIQLYRSGALGEIVHVDRNMLMMHEKIRMMEAGHWAHEIPGGRLFEANPHNLYMLYPFLGEMDLVDIIPEKRLDKWPHAGIDGFTALLRGRKGGTAKITMAISLEPGDKQKSPPQFTMVIGTRGTVVVDTTTCLFYDEAKPQAAARPEIGKQDVLRYIKRKTMKLLGMKAAAAPTPAKPTRAPAPAASAAKRKDSSADHKQIIEHFLGYIQGKETEPLVGWDEVLTTQRLNDEMGLAVERAITSRPAASGR